MSHRVGRKGLGRFVVGAGCCVAVAFSPASALAGLSYRVDYITTPSGASVPDAADINDRGQVVGTNSGMSGADGYRWSARSGFVTLARLPAAVEMTAVAVNEWGVVAGNAELGGGTRRPVVWLDPSNVKDLGVYGRYVFASPDSSWSVETAMASDINDWGHVVGSTSAPERAEEACLWDERAGIKLLGTLGGDTSVAWAVNARDQVVGTSALPDGTRHAFFWERGTMLDLGALGGSYSEAYAINDWGVVTGVYQTASEETRVFRWTRSRGMVDVGPTYPGATGITSLSTGINLLDQIVGGIQSPGASIRAAVRQPFSAAWQELLPGSPYDSFALAVNNRGVIVGRVATSLEPESPFRAAVWTPVYSFP